MKEETLCQKKSPRVVVVMTDRFSTDSHGRLVGIQRYLENTKDWEVRFLVRPSLLTANNVRDALRHGVDGFIVDICVPADALDVLVHTNIPTVAIDVRRHALCTRAWNFVSIDCDDDEVARTGVRYFLNQGRFHSFGFDNGGITDEWAMIREQTFRHTLTELGLTCFSFQPEKRQSRAKALVRWLRALPKPAAVMAVNDDTGVDILRAAREAKIKVPDTLAVIGSDNDEFICENIQPTLSSIPPNFELEGYKAAEMLDTLMNTREPVVAQHLLVPALPTIVRDSSASVSPADFLVRKALRFIDKNACRGIGVDDVVRHLGVSRRLLYQRFREVLNETILDAIQTRRLDEVRRRLTATRETNAQIATDCGFNSEIYLMRLFKARFGMTLRTYRRTHPRCSKTMEKRRY